MVKFRRALFAFMLILGLSTNAHAVIGGENVEPSDAFAASTVAIIDFAKNEVLCTGTLISGDLVLTAAHCVLGKFEDLGILFSVDYPVSPLTREMPNLRAVIDGRVHPYWKKPLAGARGDLALLKIQGEPPCGYRPASEFAGLSDLGSVATLVGYGFTSNGAKIRPDRLQKVTLKVKQSRYTATETQFSQIGPGGICSGDSGGGSYVQVAGEWRLFGVNSETGATCVGPYGYSVVTRVESYADWIQSASDELNGLKR